MHEACVRVSGVDLRTWMTEEVSGIGERFASSIVAHIPADQWRIRVGATDLGASSIAALLFHMTLHCDLAITTVVRHHAPLRLEWSERLGLAGWASTAGLSEAEDPSLTSALDLDALVEYHHAVQAATLDWLDRVAITVLDSVPDSEYRLGHLAGVGASEVPWLIRMWSGRSIGWFAQWPAVGHRQGHLGEMTGIRSQLGRSPF